MGKKGVKRKNSRPTPPPLTILDKLIYYAILALVVILGLAGCVWWMGVTRDYALKEPSVIAYYSKGDLLAVAFPFTFLMVVFVFWMYFYSDRKPIFGDKNIRYGLNEYRGIYPLFYKNKPELTDKQKLANRKGRMILAGFVCIILVISASISALGFFPRVVMYDEYSVRVVNMFNNTKQIHLPEEIREISVIARKKPDGRNFPKPDFWVKISFMDGNAYSFDLGTFAGEREERIKKMISLKESVPKSSVNIIIDIDLDKVRDYFGLSADETRLLYELFSQ